MQALQRDATDKPDTGKRVATRQSPRLESQRCIAERRRLFFAASEEDNRGENQPRSRPFTVLRRGYRECQLT